MTKTATSVIQINDVSWIGSSLWWCCRKFDDHEYLASDLNIARLKEGDGRLSHFNKDSTNLKSRGRYKAGIQATALKIWKGPTKCWPKWPLKCWLILYLMCKKYLERKKKWFGPKNIEDLHVFHTRDPHGPWNIWLIWSLQRGIFVLLRIIQAKHNHAKESNERKVSCPKFGEDYSLGIERGGSNKRQKKKMTLY